MLYDADTQNISYDKGRGEPRGKYTKDERGACIDCFRCVSVCPTGIDIRNGTQMECIGCANCVDACDEVMEKIGQPKGLIRYASQNQLEGKHARFWRPRVFLYFGLLLLGSVVFLFAAMGRTSYEATIIRNQGAPYTLEGEIIRNVFYLHLINKFPERTKFTVEAQPADGIEIVIPITEAELDSFENRRLPFFATVLRTKFQQDMRVRIRVTGGEDVRELDIKLLGVKSQ